MEISHSPSSRLNSDLSFTDHELSYDDLKTNLTAAMQAYLSTMADLGADTWIMHGTLLGWWWNRKVGFCIVQDAYHGVLRNADHALGFRYRRPSLIADYALPRKLL